VEQRPDLGFGARAIRAGERLEIQPVEQLAMDACLQIEILLARLRRRRRYGHERPSGTPGVAVRTRRDRIVQRPAIARSDRPGHRRLR